MLKRRKDKILRSFLNNLASLFLHQKETFLTKWKFSDVQPMQVRKITANSAGNLTPFANATQMSTPPSQKECNSSFVLSQTFLSLFDKKL